MVARHMDVVGEALHESLRKLCTVCAKTFNHVQSRLKIQARTSEGSVLPNNNKLNRGE